MTTKDIDNQKLLNCFLKKEFNSKLIAFKKKIILLFIITTNQCLPHLDKTLSDFTLLFNLSKQTGTTCFFLKISGEVQEGRYNERKECISVYPISGRVLGLTRSRIAIITEDRQSFQINTGSDFYQIKILEGTRNPLRFERQPIGLYCAFTKEVPIVTQPVSDIDIQCQPLGGLAIGLMDTFYSSCYDDAAAYPSCNVPGFPLQDGDIDSPLSANYIDNTDGTITDRTTGLTWRKCITGISGTLCSTGTLLQSNYTTGATYCSGDFRLPTIKELATLNRYGHATLKIDPAFFPNINSNLFRWTQNISPIDGRAYTKQFDANNFLRVSDPTATNGITHCVKNTSILKETFIDLGNGVVRDNKLGLEWQKCHLGQNAISCIGTSTPLGTWQLALQYCNNLTLNNHSDWRLPNIHELTSLIIFSNSNPSKIDPSFVNFDTSRPYYSSSTNQFIIGVNAIDFSSTNSNITFSNSKTTSPAFARCVRGPD